MSESEQSTIPSDSIMIQSNQTDMNQSNVMKCSPSQQIQMKRLEEFYCKKHAIMCLTAFGMVLSVAAFIYILITKDEVGKLIHKTKPEISAENATQGWVLIMSILISYTFTYSLIASMASYRTSFGTLSSLIIDVILIALTYFFIQDLRDLRHLPQPHLSSPKLLESTG
uniref:Uncharacterized protein LOC113794779 isoform X2 n=1 Tax=Dermatophagoides pteronyssinus TaxID=6956 RepID=A0A6P6Y6T3_DERPT|nr:uncharacterized protein LOC113794779 isoform X2 [Dermatophagoides pteronyssinus]